MFRLRVMLCCMTLLASCAGDAGEPTTNPVATAPTATVAPATTAQPVATTTTTSTTQPAPTTTVAADNSDEGATWLTADQPGSTVFAALDPEDRLVVGYWTSVDGAVRVLRCADPDCVGPKETFTLGSLDFFEAPNESLEPYLMDMALDLEGSPIVIARDPSQEPLRIFTCADPDCTEVLEADFVTARADYARIGVAADGLPRIVYFELGPNAAQLMLAVCGDQQCSAEQRSTQVIDDDATFYGEPNFVIDPDGRLLIGYDGFSQDGPPQARVAVCADATCSTSPTIITFDNAVGPRITNSNGNEFTVWYRSGPAFLEEGDFGNTNVILNAFELHAVECDTAGCGEPATLPAEWGLLQGWHVDVRLASLADGDVGVTYSYWSPQACAEFLELWRFDPGLDSSPTKLASYTPFWGGNDSLAQGDELLVIFSGEGGGLQLVRGSPMDEASNMDDSPCDE